MTKRMTPIHDPANMPLEVICQVEEMKQASTVFQFQSIYLQLVHSSINCYGLAGVGHTEILQAVEPPMCLWWQPNILPLVIDVLAAAMPVMLIDVSMAIEVTVTVAEAIASMPTLQSDPKRLNKAIVRQPFLQFWFPMLRVGSVGSKDRMA